MVVCQRQQEAAAGTIIYKTNNRVPTAALSRKQRVLATMLSRALGLGVALCIIHSALAASFIPPFYRELSVQSPALTGADVNVTQHLVVRDAAVTVSLHMTGKYDAQTAAAVTQFQEGAL